MSADDRGLILRLAFDDAVKKMLPSLDRKLLARSRVERSEAAAAAAEAGERAGEAQALAFCAQCGAKTASGAAFCTGCGAKLGG
jgi:membrane protease subunit (stomatin/prohibitin family)